MTWLPTFRVMGWTACERDGEYEGRALIIHWRDWAIEFAWGRFE